MISKAQERTLGREIAIAPRVKMSAMEKSMLRWAVIDPKDKVLDANIGEGLMAEYLKRNELCELCGISESMEDVKRARARLRGCDIVYAVAGDIPWPDNAFDVALYRMVGAEYADTERRIKELERVLKEGGQLVIGFASAIGRAISQRPEYGEAEQPCFRELSDTLGRHGFMGLSRQRAGLMGEVLVAWKRKPTAEDAAIGL